MGQLNAGVVPVTPFQQNCTILFDTDDKTGVVVDPGGDVDQILAALSDNGIKASAIWLTHGHIDHAGGAMELKEALGVEIIGPHEADKPLLDNIENQAKRFGVGDAVRNCVPDRFLNEGDTVSFGEHVFEVQARNEGEPWPETSAQLHILRRAPWYQRPWVWLLSTLLALILLLDANWQRPSTGRAAKRP